MTSVPDYETDVVLLGELDRSNNIVGRGDVDGIAHVVAKQAGPGLRLEGIAALVGKVGLHNR